MIDATVGTRITAKREDAGLSQRELARRIGSSVGWVQQVENGLIKDPRSSMLDRCARELGTTIEALLHGEDPSETEQGAA